MGQDKAFISFGNELLISRLLRIVSGAVDNVYISGPKVKFSGFARVVEDIYPNSGPLSAIHAGLSCSEQELNLFVAVDQPFMSADFLLYILAAAQESSALVTVPRLDGIFQPLCAVYRQDFEELADQALSAGRNRIDALFNGEEIRVIDRPEFTQQGFDVNIFTNVNTPREVELARSSIA